MLSNPLKMGYARPREGAQPQYHQTVNSHRPLLRLDFKTLRPVRLDMRLIKPCTRLRGLFLGWYVRFIVLTIPPSFSNYIIRQDIRQESGCQFTVYSWQFSAISANSSPEAPFLARVFHLLAPQPARNPELWRIFSSLFPCHLL